MGLFRKKINPQHKLLQEALEDYQNQAYEECYRKVCSVADTENARGIFCKALLLFQPKIVKESEPNIQEYQQLLQKACDLGNTYAYGMYAMLLEELEEWDNLCHFCVAHPQIRDGLFQLYRAKCYLDIYVEGYMNQDMAYDSMKKSVMYLKETLKLRQTNSDEILKEYEMYNPFYSRMTWESLYGHAHLICVFGYYIWGNDSERKAFMESYQLAMQYLNDDESKLTATRFYAMAIFDNIMQMSDLRLANQTISAYNQLYASLPLNSKEKHQDAYNALWDKYETYYAEEKKRLEEREVYYSDGYANQNDLSFMHITSALSHLASHPSQIGTTTYYTIGNKRYTRGDLGYLYDEQGLRSEYKVDDYARLYDGNNRELGYYNVHGCFIENEK